MTAPLLSVILPFYNNAATLDMAVRSVLRQTVTNLELILIDDGSTDNSQALAQRWKDPRIRLFQNEQNLGVSRTRNRGLDLMRGEFMAPMDADDRWFRHRLEWTLQKLRENPALGICGGRALWKGWSPFPFVCRLPWGPDAVQAYLLYGMPSPHGSLLFRASLIRERGARYPEHLKAAVDYDFYRQCAQETGADNVPRVVMEYHRNPAGITHTHGRAATARRLQGLREELLKLLPDGVDEDTVRFHARWGNGTGASDSGDLEAGRAWLEKLERINAGCRVYSVEGLAKVNGLVWFHCCRNSAHLGRAAWRAWMDSPWTGHYRPTPSEWFSFAGSGLMAACIPSRRKPQGALRGL
ncbi:MAG: glycosyltransferase family 2 protein [Kiritimatiellia bacterium]|nr:glycosyltransferase family 2 protein [Kiritimatiellia bacterium]